MHLLLFTLLAALPARETAIRPEALRAHMNFLASDGLEGRRTGTRGYDVAAAYVATHFEALGLKTPYASGYYQSVPFREGVVDVARAELTLRQGGADRRLIVGEDFLPFANLAREQGEIEAPLVFVGQGISAPERGHDDYAGVDVRGKIVLLTAGAPAAFPSEERAHYSSTRNKRENALAHGAAGVLSFLLPQDQKRLPWGRLRHELTKGSNGWRHADGSVDGASAQLRASAMLSVAQTESVFGGREAYAAMAQAIEAGQSKSRELPVRARLQVVTRYRDFESPNVVGLLEGSDPALRDEAVVFSAHLDHEGVGEPVEGDAIRNGFFDNASGIASLLEIARSLVADPQRPRRSVLFLACVAEEEGLLGSEYFARHPPRKPVANVNTDMFLAVTPIKQIVAFGAEHSSLGPVVREEAGKAGFVLGPDPFPRETIFVRSDQYSFVKQGVPAVMIAAGFDADPKSASQLAILGWMGSRYHRPSDDATQPVDWDSLVRFTQLNRRIGQRLAAEPARPAWTRGDFFGRLFGGMK